VLALLSIVQPQDERLIALIADILRDPPTVALANTAFLCFDAFAANGIGAAWNGVFQLLTSMGLKAYEPGEPFLEYIPKDYDRNEALFRSRISSHPLGAVFTSMLALMHTNEPGVFMNKLIRLGSQLESRGDVEENDRRVFRALVQEAYLNMNGGWNSAVDLLVDPNWGDSAENLTVLGSGLSSIGPRQRLTVLDQLVQRNPAIVVQPPFNRYINEAIAGMAVPDRMDVMGTSQVSLSWAIITQTEDHWIRQTLSGTDSPILYRKCSAAIKILGRQAEFNDKVLTGVMAASGIILSSKDLESRYSCARALLTVMRSNPTLQPSYVSEIRSMLEGFVVSESLRSPSERDQARLDAIQAGIRQD
jgi:hypothetical protein